MREIIMTIDDLGLEGFHKLKITKFPDTNPFSLTNKMTRVSHLYPCAFFLFYRKNDME